MGKAPGRQTKDPRDRELEWLRAENAKMARKLEMQRVYTSPYATHVRYRVKH